MIIRHLPNEVLHQIIQLILPIDIDCYCRSFFSLGTRNILNVARCSSHFRDLALPILYTNSIFNSAENLPTFIYSILARPDLVRCLRRFSAWSQDWSADMSRITDTNQIRLNAAIRVASRSDADAEKWIKSIKSGNWDAMIALILSIVPNIEVLHLVNYTGVNDQVGPFIPTIFRNAMNLQNQAEVAPFAMEYLHHISLCGWYGEHGFRVNDLMPFLGLKTLTSFSFRHMFQDLESQMPGWSDLGVSSTIKNLALDHCVIHHEIIILFLRFFHI